MMDKLITNPGPIDAQLLRPAGAPTGRSDAGAPRPRWMRPARVGWLVCVAAILAVYVPAGVAMLLDQGPEIVARMVAQGQTPLVIGLRAGGAVGVAGVTLFALVVAAVLFFKRPDDPMALFLAYFYIIFGFIHAGPGPLSYLEGEFLHSHYIVDGLLQTLLFGPMLVLLLCLFPDGRCAPAWTRRLAIAGLVYAPLSAILFTSMSPSVAAPASVVGVLGWFALFFAGLFAQIRRYRFVSGPVERQQTKWVIYGFGVAVLFAMLPSLATVRLIVRPAGLPSNWWAALIGLSWAVSSAALPLTLSFAVLRYRLYAIDQLINRTLVYGLLTAGIVGLYVLLVGALGAFFQTQSNLLVALLAAGLVAALFQPLRARLQRAVNHLFYGERDDPVEALAKLGRRLEAAVPPDQVLPALVETIAQTLKLPYVAIHLPLPDGRPITAEYGEPVPDVVRLPLVYQGAEAGELAAAPRTPGGAFTPAEMRLLRNLARQAGSAAHSVRLTGELLRSRQQLITAREEERRRLRRDLHDGLGATLAGLNLEAAAVRRSIRSDPAGAEATLDEFQQDIRASIEDIRRLVYALRPPMLDQLGLVEAVRAQAAQCSREPGGKGLQISVEAPATLPHLPAAVEVAAYRIAQEALTNVASHAQARHCVVRLEAGDALRLEIVDDGVGLPAGRRAGGGLGLLSMRERAEELGGACRIEPAPGGGTQVSAWLPLPAV